MKLNTGHHMAACIIFYQLKGKKCSSNLFRMTFATLSECEIYIYIFKSFAFSKLYEYLKN